MSIATQASISGYPNKKNNFISVMLGVATVALQQKNLGVKLVMKKILLALAVLVAAVTQVPGQANAGTGPGENYVGPALNFGNGQTTVGVNSKFGVSDNLSIRPFLSFPSQGTEFGASVTYDFDLSRSQTDIKPFAGAGINFSSGSGVSDSTVFLQAGADFNISREFSINGSLNVPLRTNNSTYLSLGGALRF